MSFMDRSEAGKKLAVALKQYEGKNPVVLALPRGGVPVAAEVAAALHAPLGLVLVRKIGVPMRPELAMGAVVDGAAPVVVRNEDIIRYAAIDDAEFKRICDLELAEIERRKRDAPAQDGRKGPSTLSEFRQTPIPSRSPGKSVGPDGYDEAA